MAIIRGTSRKNKLLGTTSNDIILGLGGDDEISARGGDDRVRGGDGNDIIKGGAGNDRIKGDAGNDTLYGDSGNDILTGGLGDDTIIGGTGTDTAVFSGLFSAYTLVAESSGLLRVTGPSGSDLVSANTERLQFTDITITNPLIDPNDAPVTAAQTLTSDEDVVLEITLTATDADLLDAVEEFVIKSLPAGGDLYATATDAANQTNALTINATILATANQGTLYFRPDANFNGTTDFDVAANDGTDEGAASTIDITVDSVNDDPVATDDARTTSEDTAVTFYPLSNDSDVDGDALTITAATVTGGTVSGTVFSNSDGTLTFTPDSNQNGTAEITYTVSDGNGGTDTAVVTITVNAVNDAPTAANGAASGAEDQAGGIAIDVAALVADVEDLASALTITASVPPAQGTVSVAGTVITFTPAANFNGPASISYSVEDTEGATASGTIAVTVDPVDDDPTAPAANAVTTDEDTASAPVAIGASDVDGDALTYAVKAGAEPAKGSVSFAGGAFVYTPNANANGSDTFTIEVSDGAGTKAEQVVTVTINPVNDAPEASAPVLAAVTEDGTLPTIDLLATTTDIDGGTLAVVGGSLVQVSGPTLATAATVNGSNQLVLDPADPAFQGLALGETVDLIYTYDITDGAGGTEDNAVIVTVTGTNDQPQVVAHSFTIDEDSAVTFNPLSGATDADLSDTLTISAITLAPANVGDGILTGPNADGTYTFTPAADFSGSVVVNYTVTDSSGALNATASSTVTITVDPVNDAPEASAPVLAGVTEDGTLPTIDLLATTTDIDGGTLAVVGGSLVQVSGPTLATAATVNGSNQLVLDPADPAFQGLALGETVDLIYTYDITDGAGGTEDNAVIVTVTGTNDQPQVVAHSFTIDEDSAVTFNPLSGATDADNSDTLTISAITLAPANAGDGILTGPNADGTYTFTPAADFSGSVVVNYTVTDSSGALNQTASSTVTITVDPVNDAPVSAADIVTSANENIADTVVVATASATDVDGPAVTYAITGGNDGTWEIDANTGAISLATGQTLDRETDAASYTLTVTASDGTLTDTQQITINVNDLDEFDVTAPTDANGAPNSVVENAAVGTVVAVTASASDADATTNAVTYAFAPGGNPGGLFAINATTGVVTVAGAIDRETVETASIVIRATSADGSFADSAPIAISVADVDEFDVGAITDLNAGANSVAENAAIGATVGISAHAGDGDHSNNGITYSLDDSAGGRFAINSNTGVVTLAGPLDHEAATSHTITVRATSQDYSFSTQSFTITVADVNDVAPSITSASVVDVDENTTAVVTLTSTDPDTVGTNPATFTITGGADQLAFEIVGGQLRFKAANTPDYEAPADAGTDNVYVVQVTANDGANATVQTITVNVQNVDDNDPVAVDDTNAVTEDSSTATGGNVLFDGPGLDDSDADDDGINPPPPGHALTVVGAAAGVGVPAAFAGSTTIDGTYGRLELFDDGTYSYQLGVTPAQQTAVNALNVGDTPTDVFTYELSDGSGATDTATLTITVNGTNDAPEATDDITTGANEGSGNLVIDVIAAAGVVDPDNTAVSLAVGTPTQFIGPTVTASVTGHEITIDTNDTDLDYLADGETVQLVYFLEVTDANGGFDDVAIIVTVTGTNDQPVALGDTVVTSEDVAVTFNPLANDTDVDVTDVLTVTGVSVVSGGGAAVVNGDGTITYTPATNYSGPVELSYTLSDDSGAGNATTTGTVNITVNAVNDAPVATDDTASVTEDGTTTAAGNVLTDATADSDVESTPLAVANAGTFNGTYGQLVLESDGDYTYTLGVTAAQSAAANALAEGQVVTDTFSYTASDGSLTDMATLTVTITGNNDAPTANAAVATGLEDAASIAITLTGTDPDALDAVDSFTVSAPLPANGTLYTDAGLTTAVVAGTPIPAAGNAVTLYFVPNANFAGSNTFSYTVSDGDLSSAAATAAIIVNNVNDAPSLDLDGVAAGTGYTGDDATEASPSATPGSADSNGRPIASGPQLSDPDAGDLFKTISLSLAGVADTNGPGGNKGYLTLTTQGLTLATSLGLTPIGAGSDVLTLSAATNSEVTASQVEALLAEVRYVNNETTFAMDTADRVVTVTVTDVGNATSAPVTATVPVVAVVLDLSSGLAVNNFTGTRFGDTILGNTGDDLLTGGAGDDVLYGGVVGVDSGTGDTAVYADARADYTLGVSTSSGFVTAFNTVTDTVTAPLDEGTDTLTGIEKLSFDGGATVLNLNQPVQVFNAANALVGTFDTIQAAIDAADAGFTVRVSGSGGPGVNDYALTNEAITLSEGITLVGLGGVTVASVTVTGGGVGQSLTIDNIDVTATGLSGATVAVAVASAADYDAITFTNGDVTGGKMLGFQLADATGVDAVTISNASFTGNAYDSTNPAQAGESAIQFYHYNGNVTLTNVAVSAPGADAENGIAFVGTGSPTSADGPMGTVTLSGVSVTGAFSKTGVAIYDYTDISGLTFAGANPAGSLAVNVTAAFAGLNIDGIGGNRDLSDTGAPGLQVTNTHLVAADISVQSRPGTGANTFTGDTSDDNLFGNDGDDTLTGGGGDDLLWGGTGADQVAGGDGSDNIVYMVGDGAVGETLDGGNNADALLILDSATASDVVTVTVNGSGVITTLDGGTVSSVEAVTAAVDNTIGAGGTLPSLVGDTGSDTLSYSGTTAMGVTVDLTAGTATGFVANPVVTLINPAVDKAIQGFENVTGGSGADTLSGDAGANTLTGGDGDDTLTGRAGNDTLVGGTDSAGNVRDKAVYAGNYADATITIGTPAGSITVTDNAPASAGDEGTDTLTGVETIQFADRTVHIVDSSGTFGAFTTIGAAISAAAAGDVIIVLPGTTGTYNESLTVDKALTITGYGGSAAVELIVDDAGATAFNVTATSGVVQIQGFTVTGSGGADYGVRHVSTFASGANGGLTALETDHLDVSGFDEVGFFVSGGGTDLSVVIEDSTYTGNGGAATSGGNGDITLFEFTGDAELTNVTVTGTTGTGAGSADHGIQIAGYNDLPADNVTNAIGSVSFNNVTVTGSYEKTLVFVQGYSDLAGLTFTGTTIGSAGSATSWTGLYVNPNAGDTTPPTAADGTNNIDISGVTFGGGTYGWTSLPAAYAIPSGNLINGGDGVDNIVGGSGRDAIAGGAGNDVVDGAGGNDLVLLGPGAGADRVNGGAGTDDVLRLVNFIDLAGTGNPNATTFTITNTLDNGGGSIDPGSTSTDILITADIGGAGPLSLADFSALIDNVEEIEIYLGSGGDTVVVTTPLGGTSISTSTITVTGGTGADTVDAGAIDGGHAVGVVFDGGGGSDTFISGAGNDTFTGGGDTDTVSYEDATSGVTVDLTAGSNQATGGGGTDQLSGVENVTGSAHADTITGDGQANVITTGGGNDVVHGGGGSDTVVVPGNSSGYTFAVNPTTGVITLTGPDGADAGTDPDVVTVHPDVESLQFANTTFDLTAPVRVVSNTGELLSTHTTIGAAVSAAVDGQTIQILGQTTSFDESVTVSEALSFVGIDVGNGLPTITSTGGNAFTLSGTISGGTGNVSFTGLTITNAAGSGIQAHASLDMGTLSLVDVSINNSTNYGIDISSPVVGAVTALSITETVAGTSGFSGNVYNAIFVDNAVGTVTIAGSGTSDPISFANNGQQPLAGNGAGDISLFQFNGNATLQHLALTNVGASTTSGAQTGIQLRSDTGAIGTVLIEDVTIDGSYGRQPIAIFNYDNIDGLTMTDVTVNANSTGFGHAINIDGVGGTVDFTNTSGTGAKFDNVTAPNLAVNGDNIAIQGDGTVNAFTGGNDANLLRGFDGTDTLVGGGGNDTIVGDEGDLVPDGLDGADQMTGGAGDDLLIGDGGNDVANFTATTLTSASFSLVADVFPTTVGGLQPGWSVDATSGGEGTDTLHDVEIIEHGGAGRILLVGNGGFATIMAAVGEAQSGDTILIAAGTYIEQVDINGLDNLTLQGVGGTVTIQAPADVVETARSSSDREMHAVVTVENGTNVTLKNIDVDGAGRANTIDEGGGAGQANYVGVFYRNASGTVENVDITGVRDPYELGTTADGFPIVSGIQRGIGIQVDNDTQLAFTMTGGSISDFQKNATVFNNAVLNVTGVTITGGGAQTINAQNGIQVLNSTGTISGNTISAIGYAGPAVAYSGMILAFGNTNLDITGNTITGPNTGAVIPAVKTVGIYVFDLGADNSGGSITGNTISYVDVGIDVSGDIQPSQIAISNNTVTNLDLVDPYVAGVSHAPTSTLTTLFNVEGTAAADYLAGAAAADTLTGLGGNDVIEGLGGTDTLSGGAGADVFLVSTPSHHTATETIVGGSEEDAIRFTSTTANDTLVLSANVSGVEIVALSDAAGSTAGTTALNLDASAGNTDITDLFGNDGANTITGTAFDERIYGHGGNDTITGGDGIDTIFGGEGDDTVNWATGDGSDVVEGDGQATATGDTLAVTHSGGAITVTAGASDFTVDDGADTVTAAEIERLNMTLAAVATATIVGAFTGPALATATITGSTGDDTVDAGDASGIDVTFNAGDGDDTFVSGAGNDTFNAGEGAEDAGGDTVSYADASGSVTVNLATSTATGDGTDTLTNVENIIGSGFADTLTGDANDNDIQGGVGNDTIVGGGGVDTIHGGDGDDTITGGLGADFLYGDAGDDTFNWASGDGNDTVHGGSNATANGDHLNATFTTGADTITVTNTTVSDGTATITYDTLERITLAAGAGNDTIVATGLTGPVLFVEGGGADAVTIDTSGPGGSYVDHSGGDTLDFTGAASVTVNLLTDTFKATSSAVNHDEDSIENVTGSGNGDDITGDGNSNVLIGAGGADTISGGAGADVLFGGDGADDMLGGTGIDHLFGGFGQDILEGGNDADFYYFGAGDGFLVNSEQTLHFDTVQGFSTPGGDKLVIDGGSAPFASLGVSPIDYVAQGVNGLTFGYSGATLGNATFIRDVNDLWYDDAGDGTADFKLVQFDAADFTGFGTSSFIII